MTIKETIKNDFSDIEELINNPNHIVRRYYTSYLDGNYGQEIYKTNLAHWERCKTDRQKRTFVIQTFCNFNALDYNCSYGHLQNCLMDLIGLEKLEELNLELIKDATEVYNNKEV